MKTWIRLIIGLVLIAILLYLSDLQRTFRILAGAKLIYIFVATAFLSLNIPISSLKWKILLRAKNIQIHWWRLTSFYWISTFFGNYLPSSVGGDIVRFVMMNKYGHRSVVAASIVWERITGFFILLIWSAAALWIEPAFFVDHRLLYLLWSIVAAGIGAIVIIAAFGDILSRGLNRIFDTIHIIPRKIAAKIEKYSDAFVLYRSQKRALLLSVLISIPFYGMGMLCNYIVFLSLGTNVPLIDLVVVLPLVNVISLLPITLNGLGLSEGAYVLFFVQAGVPPPVALAAAVIRRGVHLMVSLIGGGIWLAEKPGLKEQAVNMQHG